MKFIIALLFTFSSWAHAMGCYAGDTEISRFARQESMPCQTNGYCYAYDHNPQTGAYEYYYGYHQNCPGNQYRTVTQFTCQFRDTNNTYSTTDYGMYGICQIN